MTTNTATSPLVTVDGVPLKQSLARAQRHKRNTALMLVLPLFLFITVTFFIPIFNMLTRSVDNPQVMKVFPDSAEVLKQWDETSGELPDENFYSALAAEFKVAKQDKSAGAVGRRLNYDKPGFSSLYRKTTRKADTLEAPFRESFIGIDKKWGKIDYLTVLKRESGEKTKSYYLSAVDMGYDAEGNVISKPKEKSIHLKLFWRTFWISMLITLLCLVLAYPIAYLLATLPAKTSNLLMILVLLPFWTSLLVRTSAWIALLQQEGVINDILVWLNLIDDGNRLAMIHNSTGTIIAMVHVLLPFMVLPLYSVMKTISPSYMRAARSLGANQLTAFVRVYMPNTVPGIGAGSILVFILAIGYYITPALVGGQSGTLISNTIAYHLESSLNWGLAAALGAILLGIVLVLYLLYDKIVGIDNMKLG